MPETVTLTKARYDELLRRIEAQQSIIDRQNAVITARNREIAQLKRLQRRKEAA